MAKTENTSQYEPSLDEDQKALVAALTAAIVAARRDAPPTNPAATAAATQYAEIKGVLRTHSEPLPQANT